MFTVMGATGHTGGVVADRLLAAGKKVRAIGRSTDRLQPLTKRGAEPAVGDANEVAFLTSAFQGAEGVYAMVPPDYAAPDQRAYYNRIGAAIENALRSSGVRKVVFLSSLGGERSEGTGPITGLHDLEERFRRLGIDLLVLRPGYFYENFYSSLGLIKHQGINGGAMEPEIPVTMTATNDIGAVAAEELIGGKFNGTGVRELLGPRDYTMSEATRILGGKIGKPDLKYVRFPDAEFAKALVQAGFSQGAADAFVEMSQAFNTGKIRSLEGRNPRNTTPTTFEKFADQLAAAYRKM
ncbi:MAG: NmrA family NAD(P)-binding protein [Nitrospirae bacterium]|nr:NmrA family NAD(P)-binding protein [Candidatus Manganitrophaceae bacterium]